MYVKYSTTWDMDNPSTFIIVPDITVHEHVWTLHILPSTRLSYHVNNFCQWVYSLLDCVLDVESYSKSATCFEVILIHMSINLIKWL